MYADPNRDESIIIELLELEQNVEDAQSAVWFLHDLSHEQDAGQTLVCFFVLPTCICIHANRKVIKAANYVMCCMFYLIVPRVVLCF